MFKIVILLLSAYCFGLPVLVESATSIIRDYCVGAPLSILPDVSITAIVASRSPVRPFVYIRTSPNNGIYRIENSVGNDLRLQHLQIKVEEMSLDAFNKGRRISLCVDSSTSPYTVMMIEYAPA